MITTIAKPRMGGHACNCGCSDGTGQCCELECLVQPRFFCGQLLTDQDLSVLLDWVKGKTALSRYRHGWGVVCGLEVECDAGNGGEGRVFIQPGYAVDCCGNDIIVCERASFDLTKFCKPEQDPCSDQPPPRPVTDPKGTVNVGFGDWTLPRAEVQAVDLFVRYAESLSDARTALARGGCAPAEACESTRTREGFEFYATKVEHCEHTGGREGEAWGKDFRLPLLQLIESLQSLQDPKDWRRTAERLEQWLKGNPLHSFCFVREWLCDILRGTNPPAPQNWFEQMAYWIIQDWRNRHLRCDCHPCGPDAGVPLARVWLWRQRDADRKQRCKVVNVNSYPPFRRPLQQDCWPAPPDRINLARFIWQPMDSVSTELYKLNFGNFRTQRFTFSNLKSLYAQLYDEVIFAPSWSPATDLETLIVFYTNDNCGRSRVVYFGRKAPPQTGQPTRDEQVSEMSIARSAELTPEVSALAPDHPALDLRNVRGIGDATANKLKESGINNMRELADAKSAEVMAALSSMPINPPDEARSQAFIDEAAQRLTKLQTDLAAEGQ